MASENFLISQKHVWNETSHLLILMYCVWILAIRRDTQDIQWNVATCREAANVCNERMKHRFLLSSLQLGGRKLCLRNRSHGSPQWWTMHRRQWMNAIRWDSVLKALSTTEAKKILGSRKLHPWWTMLWKRRKTPRLQSIVQHGGRRHPLRATKAMPTPCKAFGWENLPVKCLERSWHCFSWRMQRTFNHAQLAPRKKKANAAALPGFKDRRAFGLSRRMQAQTTSSWQASFCPVSCLLFVLANFCCRVRKYSEDLPFAPTVPGTWTLHLCPVWATADCESVHRSCPRCGSRIHSQQVSVLGQPLSGILSRCIPWRTPVSSGLRSAGSHFFDNRRVTQVTSVVDNAIKTKKHKFAAHVFRAFNIFVSQYCISD